VGAAFLITLREGIEAALLISIILAYLNAIGRRDRHRTVWTGTALAVGGSLMAGAVIFLVAGELSHAASEVFEGVVSYLAVGVLTWMIFWMRRNAIRIKGHLQDKVDVAVASGSSLALGALAKGGIRLNLRTFFRVTGALILVVAASLVVYGTHELLEVGAFRFLEGTFLLEEAGALAVVTSLINRVVVGLGGQPTWLEFGLWLTYILITGFMFFRPAPAPDRAAPPAEAPREQAAQGS